MVAARRILVVDDEPLVARGCRRILTEAGYQVDTVGTGREGLNRAVREDFDLVMADLRLPDLDGMELVRRLRQQRPETAIVVITGYGSVGSAVEAVKLGVADYIEKPFTPDQITEAIGEALKPAEYDRGVRIEGELVREVLLRAGGDRDFGQRLLNEGSRVLSGLALRPEAKAAIVSGDIAWIEKECGQLTDAERDWLERRLEAEIW